MADLLDHELRQAEPLAAWGGGMWLGKEFIVDRKTGTLSLPASPASLDPCFDFSAFSGLLDLRKIFSLSNTK